MYPSDYQMPPASNGLELDASVLNNVVVSKTSGCKDSSKDRQRNKYEKMVLK
uniref:Uncharacterized protein n=1 Tax=Musa acuminata subsp. malaccensis TaxID=214687 RepID=A0A804KMG4_MUSAM